MSQPESSPTPSVKSKPKVRIRPLDWFVTRAVLVGLAVLLFRLIYEAEALRWPVRILIGGLGIWATVALVRDILWVTKVGGRVWTDLWNRVWRGLDAGPGWLVGRLWEMGCALALIAVATWHLGLVCHSMATTSLREDEIGSIHQYSSQGPFTVATEYRLAKNHIFYNLVNSLTPWSDSYQPLRARLWSYVAVLGWFAAVLVWFWRRERFIEGAAVFALGAFNLELLETLLESRGYGFIAAFAGVSALIAVNYLKSREQRWLILLSLLTVLGTWTLPFYIVYAGVLHLGLWLCRRDRATLLSGVFAGLGVILTYAPVMTDLLKVTGEYDDKYGFRYTGFEAVSITMQYLFPESLYRLEFLHAAIFLAALTLIPVVARRSARPEARGGTLAFVAALAFIIFCLKLETPPMRVTAFIATPLAVVLGLAVGMPFWGRRERPLRLILAPALAALGIWAGLQLIKEYEYLPRQMWLDSAAAIDRLLPADSKVWVNGHYTEMMSCAFKDREERLVRSKTDENDDIPPINQGAVRRGKWILFDALFKHADQPERIGLEQVPPGTRYFTLPLRVNYHRVWFNLPGNEPTIRGVADLQVGGQAQPLSVTTRQGFDPLLLARAAGPGDALYAQDDYTATGELTPAATEAQAQWKAGALGYPAPMVSRTAGLALRFSVPLRDSDLVGKENLAPNAQYVGLLLSQAASLKQVGVDWTDTDGKTHQLGASKIRRIGELIILELPRGPLRKQQIQSVEVRVDPEPILTNRNLRFMGREFMAESPDKDVLDTMPRPPLELLEIWRGAIPLPEKEAP